MKDIRPTLDKIEAILKSRESAKDVSEQIGDLQELIDQGTLLDGALSFMGCWDEGAYFDCTCEACLASFETARENCLALIEELRSTSWPDSSDSLTVSYSKPEGGFGLKISVAVSSLEVSCPHEDLRKEVQKAVSKLNHNQSAQNFLLNTVYVLPKEYKDYKLVL